MPWRQGIPAMADYQTSFFGAVIHALAACTQSHRLLLHLLRLCLIRGQRPEIVAKTAFLLITRFFGL
jgi:hypothetical protein